MEAAYTEETNIYAFQSCNKSNNNRTYRVTFKIFEAKAIHYLISDPKTNKHASQSNKQAST